MTKTNDVAATLVQQSSLIADIETLARKSEAKVQLLSLPYGALPPGLAVGTPTVAVITDGNGNVKIADILPHVEGLRGKPSRRQGTARTATLASFIDLVNRHAAQESAIFADANWKAPKFTAVIDYHQIAIGKDAALAVGDDPLARFGKHRIVYEFPLSEAWKVWLAQDGMLLDQTEFAAFIEDHIHELSSPTQAEVNEAREKFKTTVANPTDLIELSRGLEVLAGARVKNRVNLSSGEKQIVFETEHKTADGNELTVPGLFVLNIAPFYQGEPMRLFARLRYRVAGGGLLWGYELYRPDLAIEQRVSDDLATVAEQTGLPTYHGSPEMGA